MRRQWITILALSILISYGCGAKTYKPGPIEKVPFQERAQSKSYLGVRVTAAVLSQQECKDVFGLDLYKKDIQPVWLEIENKKKVWVAFMHVSVDRDYLSPLEVTYMHRKGFSKSAREEMDLFFYEQGMTTWIPPGEKRSGFAFTHVEEGTKAFNVDVASEDHVFGRITFFIPVPGLKADHQEVDFASLYSRDEIVDYDAAGLRRALESLPCCTANENGTEEDGPLNLVIVGQGDEVHRVFLVAGWDEAETRLEKSPSSSGKYRYRPVSPAYVFGRPQDVSFQQIRKESRGRDIVRLWLAPMRFEGKEVWVGQISREIEVRSASKKGRAQAIDPAIDETREYLLQDLWYAQTVIKYGYLKGVGAAPISAPRNNLRGDLYITDGLRAVVWISSKPVSLVRVEFLEWEIPPAR
jgi:hypothetical protein